MRIEAATIELQAIEKSGVVKVERQPHLQERFLHALERLMDGSGQRQAMEISGRIQSGELFSNRELLRYQYQFHDLSVRTEMVSKIGEAFTGTVRRLQQPG